MSRDYLLFLEDMQTSCEKILRYAEDLDFDHFAADEKTYDAVIFNLVILGEAAKLKRYLCPQILRPRRVGYSAKTNSADSGSDQ